MARVTVEDCLMHVENRFELVVVGAKRARQLAMTNATPTVDRQNDKPTVVALREIATGDVDSYEKENQRMHSMNSGTSTGMEE